MVTDMNFSFGVEPLSAIVALLKSTLFETDGYANLSWITKDSSWNLGTNLTAKPD
jgi:hypothetical protein